MQVPILESNRGGKIPVHDGHSYNQKQTTINCNHWRGTKYKRLKRPATSNTKNETVIEAKCTDNNNCDPGESKTKEIVKQIESGAQYLTPTLATANEISEISDDYPVLQATPKEDKLF